MARIYQPTTIEDPVDPLNVANKRYIDSLFGSVTSPIFVTDVSTTSGNVGDKLYVAGTVPANAVLNEATTDSNSVTISIVTEGPATFYSPTVTASGIPALPSEPLNVVLTEDAVDKRFFHGTVDITISQTTIVTFTSDVGTTASVTINYDANGPAITDITIGNLPIGINSGLQQTEVKENDVVPFSGSVDNDAVSLDAIVGGANKTLVNITSFGANNSAGIGFKTFSGTFPVSNLSGTQSIQVVAFNSLGTPGNTATSSNTIELNQTYPTIDPIVMTYPIGQAALKNLEVATATSAVIDFDTILYTSSADLDVGAPTVFSINKIVTRIGGDYVVGVDNVFIAAIKNSNDALSNAAVAVSIANVAPTIGMSIGGSPARLQSSPTGNVFNLTATADQILSTNPTITASSGTISAFSGSLETWTGTISISDSDAKGNQTFALVSATGLSGIVGTVISSGENYIIGGFTPRVLTYGAFQQSSDIGTTVTDVNKLVASYQDSSDLTFVANLNPQQLSFSIADRINDDTNAIYDPGNNFLWINDQLFAGSNTTGTLTVVVEETA